MSVQKAYTKFTFFFLSFLFFFYLFKSPVNYEVFAHTVLPLFTVSFHSPFKRSVVPVRKRTSLWPTIQSAVFSYQAPTGPGGCISGIIWFKEVGKNFSGGAQNKKNKKKQKTQHKYIPEYEKSTSKNKLRNK